MTDEHSNLGLLVTMQTLAGIQLDIRTVRFASGQNHHHSKQPMLVLFTDDGRRVTSEGVLKGKENIYDFMIFFPQFYCLSRQEKNAC